MIYKIEKGKTVFESNEGLETNQLFAKCSDREMKYIFWVYDIDSPYVKMRFKDRQHKAGMEAGYKKEKDGKRFDKNARIAMFGGSPKVQAAIREFRKIQIAGNTNYAVLNALTTQIERNITYIEEADAKEMKVADMIKLNQLANGLKDLIQTKVNIEDILNIDGGLDEEEDDMPEFLSVVDQMNIEEE